MRKWNTIAGWLRVAWLAVAGLLLLARPGAAQVKWGETSSSMNGSISSGYSADYGNATTSDHGWTVGGAANLSGSYHSPSFLSYDASLYLNQSRANSNFQSISNASGVNLTSSVFGGSHFPGSVSYSKGYNSEGNYAVPGVANYVTHGNNSEFGINWSEGLPDVPSVAASFIVGDSQYSVYGTNDQGTNVFHSLDLHSNYDVVGFGMGAFYTTGGGHSLIPEVLSGQSSSEIHNSNDAYGFNIGHQLPFQGSIASAISRSSWNSDYLGTRTTGTVDVVNMQASMHPAEKLYCSANANYSDNLSGQLIQSIVAAGGTGAGINTNASSDSLDLMADVNYVVSQSFSTSAFAERRSQLFLGADYGSNSFGGGATFSHPILQGSFNASVSATGITEDKGSSDALGFSASESYSNTLLGWKVNESFSYAQNVQTLLVTYMNSVFNYSANASRVWGDFNLGLGAGAGRTGLTDEPGTVSSSQSYYASMGYRHVVTATGNYSKSSGQALATGAGLVSVPVPSPTLPSDLVSLYGGDGYAFALSSTPVKGFIASASWAKSISNTSGAGIASTNENDELNALIQYQFRKLNFISGYSRLNQGFSGSGLPPENVSSFYIGVSRWFNLF